MTNKALWIPADQTDSVHPIELDQTDPYQFAKYFIGDWVERVTTPFKDINMFVDESGRLKGLPRNVRAQGFYPYGPIVGNVVVILSPVVVGEDGPDMYVRSMPEGILQKLIRHTESWL